jgi:CHAT domain-containing protein
MTRKRLFLAAAFAVVLPCAGAAEPPQPAMDRLKPGERLTRTLQGSATDRMAVPLAAGQFVRIEVMQIGTNVAVVLRDPGNRTVAEVDSANGRFGPETVVAVVQSPGDYLLEVTTPGKAGSKGTYEVTLADVREATAADREFVTAHRLVRQAGEIRKKHTAEARREALELLGRARDLFASFGDRYQQALSLVTMGIIFAESGEFRQALDLSRQSADLCHQLGDRSLEAYAQNIVGGMLDVLGDPRKALDSYGQALALIRAIGDPNREALVLSNVGKIQSDFADWPKALEYYGQGLQLTRKAGDTGREAFLLHNSGTAYLGLGDLEQASLLFEQALSMRRTVKDKPGEADTLRAIASIHAYRKQPAAALDVLQQALALYLALADRRAEAETRRLMGRSYADLGKLAEAEASARQALALERALQRRRSVAQALLDLGRILELAGRPAEALEQAEPALAEVRAIGDRNLEAVSLELMGRAESDQGNLAQARTHVAEALRLIEETRGRSQSQQLRASFFATRQDAYGFYIDLLMRLRGAKPAEPLAALALEASERSHARSLLEMLAEAGGDIREGADPKLLDREREISNLLNAKGSRLLPLLGSNTPQSAALKQEVQALESEYQDVLAAIRKNSPRYAALTQPEPLKLKQIQEEVLDADSLLLEYSLGETRSYLWAVSRDGLRAFELPGREKIEAQVAEVAGLLTARSAAPRMETAAERQHRIAQADAKLPEAARRLSDTILAPAAAAMAGKRLMVVPDGGLQRLPFAMLPLPGTGEPLVSAHEIVVLPSASALAVLRKETAGRKPAPKLLAVFADPVFDAADPRAGRAGASAAPLPASSERMLEHLSGQDGGITGAVLKIPRLPFTAQEADQILRIGRDASNLRAVGFQATRAAATGGQLSQYRYLHFATHGYLDMERPSLSALLLSQIDEKRQPQDGFLRVTDIYNSRLSAELVVLSACQTGLGKEVRGEGLMGLTRAFLYAGAPRVVVSLWNVNDRATADLMTNLYRAMLREGKRPAAALREAQLELRRQKRWESPYYWAAFVQHGDWK